MAHAGLHQLAERHRAEPPRYLPQPGRHSGHPAGRGADVEALRHLVEQHVDRHQLTAGGGIDSPPAGLDEEVQQVVLSGRSVGEHEPAGAEARELALDDE